MTEYDKELYYFKYNSSDLVLYKMTVKVRECIATLLDAVEPKMSTPRPCSARRVCAASLPYATLDQNAARSSGKP